MPHDLNDKRVIVTGGANGIGRIVAESFLGEGARVWICDIDPQAIDEFRASNPGAGASLADVSDPDQVDQFFDAATSDLGGLDILINNAGTAGPTGPIEDLELNAWRKTFAVNVDGQFLCTRRAVPMFKEQESGCIINMSSTGGLFGCPLRTPYATAKWGVIGLTKTLAMELGAYGIRVNAICPGSVEGKRIDRVIEAEAQARGISADKIRENYLRQTSLHTFVSAEDVAHLILFVCSDAGAKITGQALTVDGNTETLAQI